MNEIQRKYIEGTFNAIFGTSAVAKLESCEFENDTITIYNFSVRLVKNYFRGANAFVLDVATTQNNYPHAPDDVDVEQIFASSEFHEVIRRLMISYVDSCLNNISGIENGL